LACSEARSLLYEMFTSSTFINQFIANMLNWVETVQFPNLNKGTNLLPMDQNVYDQM
jgi:hypothetical protein